MKLSGNQALPSILISQNLQEVTKINRMWYRSEYFKEEQGGSVKGGRVV